MDMNFSAVHGHVRGLLGPTSEMSLSRTGLILFSAAFMFLCLLWSLNLGSSQKTTVVTFNQEDIARQFVMQLSQYKLSDEALRKKTEAFKKAQTEALTDYAHKHHALVMQRQHVMAGGQDATAEIMRLIALYMRDAS